ncbi:nucleoside-diphosphate-sugar epimerase-like protein [Thioalkalivibrio sulfidiphilus HL-EbGr7]|uniref:Nucleoside-diphosphate-sugar epimerase-like protein n=1 Tax=Thioalkalivibrio sulfidiphilus (strain HL-EbGR7) TaxID=396588 RepID=B8GL55_THISH|nr:ELM1/GtrOC1 family putative glycosyltransferase [Thioalkalivibrio sulfidiphilus]ACL71573.1 nucleoside-diphosphate-sugar epimerase-like protein [Thioalkalivibrio sulfidiphilus HL-EbGr7]
MSERPPLHLWILSDGNPGHYNQSAAIADRLSLTHEVTFDWIDAKLNLRGVLRPLLATALNVFKGKLTPAFIEKIYTIPEGIPEKRPDLIVSSGGKTAFLNIMLGRLTHAKTLFIGTPPGINCRQFTRLFVLEHLPRCPDSLLLDIIPTRITPQKIEEAGLQYLSERGIRGQRLWCMLIGGSSRSHHYSDKDWLELAQGMNSLAEKYGIKWLVTTSRRTDPAAERILSGNLQPRHVQDAAYWGIEPRKVVSAFLGASEVVFSTQDSLTMLTEAMMSGKPAWAIYPRDVRLEHKSASFYREYLRRNINLGRLLAIEIHQLPTINPEGRIKKFREGADKGLMEDIDTELSKLI